MTSIEEADSWVGRTAVDNTGEQIGMISQIWVDDASGQPELASVTSGALGRREALVPLAGAVPLGGGRQFAYSKEEILDAPVADQSGRLSVDDKERVASYYGAPGAAMAPPPPGWIQLADAPRPPVPDFLQAQVPVPAEPVPVVQQAKQAKRRFLRKPATA